MGRERLYSRLSLSRLEGGELAIKVNSATSKLNTLITLLGSR